MQFIHLLYTIFFFTLPGKTKVTNPYLGVRTSTPLCSVLALYTFNAVWFIKIFSIPPIILPYIATLNFIFRKLLVVILKYEYFNSLITYSSPSDWRCGLLISLENKNFFLTTFTSNMILLHTSSVQLCHSVQLLWFIQQKASFTCNNCSSILCFTIVYLYPAITLFHFSIILWPFKVHTKQTKVTSNSCNKFPHLFQITLILPFIITQAHLPIINTLNNIH